MNNKLKIILFAVAIIICSLLLTSIVSGQDFIDQGGDWGGSNNSGSYGGSDYDSSGSGGFFFFGGGSDGEGGDFSLGGTIVFIIIIVVVLLVRAAKKKDFSGTSSGGTGGNFSQNPLQMSYTYQIDNSSLQKIKEIDPDFSEAAMLSKAENLFTTMQLAWCKQDYEPMRPFLSNALYEHQAKQIKDKIARDEKNVSSGIAVLESKLEMFSTDGHTEFLNVWMRVKLKDYIVKISDPTKIITGDPNRTFYLDFRWQFTRSAGAKTIAATDAVKTGECPTCGANININQSGKCEYCGSVISTTEYDWVLSKIDALQQRSR